jgi:hypothetical protein
MQHRTWVAVLATVLVVAAVAVVAAVMSVSLCSCGPGGGVTTGPPPLPQYAVTFHEVGLKAGVSWGVEFSGSNYTTKDTSLTFVQHVSNTYTYEVIGAVGYTATPSSGTLGLYQPSVSSLISFVNGVEPTYSVRINVTSPGAQDLGPFSQVLYLNLSDGTSVSSVDGANISFSAPDGTYGFSAHSSDRQWTPDPRSGTFVIAGAAQEFPIELLPLTFNLTFTEAGLPTGTFWNLTVVPSEAAGNLSGSTESLSVARWNGTFDFSVSAPQGYTASPSQGTAWVNGSSLDVTIEFSLPSNPVYPIIFSESGLSNRSGWWITLDGDTQWAGSGFTITFYGPAATYSFVVGFLQGYNAPGPYTVYPAAGEIDVYSGTVVQQISFSLE